MVQLPWIKTRVFRGAPGQLKGKKRHFQSLTKIKVNHDTCPLGDWPANSPRALKGSINHHSQNRSHRKKSDGHGLPRVLVIKVAWGVFCEQDPITSLALPPGTLTSNHSFQLHGLPYHPFNAPGLLVPESLRTDSSLCLLCLSSNPRKTDSLPSFMLWHQGWIYRKPI